MPFRRSSLLPPGAGRRLGRGPDARLVSMFVGLVGQSNDLSTPRTLMVKRRRCRQRRMRLAGMNPGSYPPAQHAQPSTSRNSFDPSSSLGSESRLETTANVQYARRSFHLPHPAFLNLQYCAIRLVQRKRLTVCRSPALAGMLIRADHVRRDSGNCRTDIAHINMAVVL